MRYIILISKRIYMQREDVEIKHLLHVLSMDGQQQKIC